MYIGVKYQFFEDTLLRRFENYVKFYDFFYETFSRIYSNDITIQYYNNRIVILQTNYIKYVKSSEERECVHVSRDRKVLVDIVCTKECVLRRLDRINV